MRHTVKEVCLKNGTRGLLVNIPDATVMSAQFNFRAGNRYTKSNDIYETAHIMEHMAFGANSKFENEHAFEAEFTKNGAYHNAFTSDFSMEYESECADFEWERILDLQLLSISSPKFNDFELKSEKGNVRNELTEYLESYGRLLWPKIQQVFGDKVLTYPERLKTIDNISIEDIREHHKRTHTTDNMRFVVAGKITPEREQKIIEKLEKLPLPRGERFEFIKDELKRPTDLVHIQKTGKKNISFALSLVLPRKMSEKELMAMNALNHILTGTMFSRIYGQARKHGLAYGVYSNLSRGKNDTSWDFESQTSFNTALQLAKLISKELKKAIDEGVTEKELDAMKSFGLGFFQRGQQTVLALGNYYGDRYFWNGEIRDREGTPDMIKAISLDEIYKLSREFMRDAYWCFGTVSDGKKEIIEQMNNEFKQLFDSYKSK